VVEATPEEPGLLARAAAGELEAVRQLIDSVGPVVYGFVFARIGGDQGVAEDLVQETFEEAVRSHRTFRGESTLSTWMCAIARRRLARHYETERRRRVAASELAVVPAAGEENVEEADEVVRALGRLSPMHRQVLVLKYVDDLPVEDVAREIGRTRVQVQSLLQRARNALRHELEESGAGSD
jgi:RNA polymerase sigma-70 factor, ECF subfamily